MSSGGPNLRVGLEVNIFGHEQLRRAQRSLSALGLSIEGVQSALVDVNGRQRRFITGVVQLTGATHELREEQSRQARAAIENATANAQVSTSIRRTSSAATQSRRQLRELERQNDRTAAAARRLADAETRAANAAAQRNRVLQNQAVLNAVQRGVASQQRVGALRNQLNQAIMAANVGQGVGATFGNAQAALRNPGLNNGRPMTPAQILRANQAGINQAQRLVNGGGRGGRGHGGWGGGGGGYGGHGGFGAGGVAGSVGRVIAYDMLRRMITNLYQGFWRIHEVLGQWVVDSVKFNDELNRAKTVFQGIGLIGTKNKDGSPMTISQAEMSSDKVARENAKQANINSDKLIKELMSVSALTGSNMEEVIAAGRQLLPDLINKMNKPGQKNAFLENPELITKVITDMVKSAAVFKMSDPGGRPLKWHMFGIQEAFAGTSGGSKDKGKEAVRSLRTREGIKVSDKTATELSKAVNAGDIKKAAEILSDVFERSGQGISVLSNLLKKTLQPNIDGVINSFKVFGKDFTKYLYKDLVADFFTIREALVEIISDDRYQDTIKKLSNLFADQFGDIRTTVFKYLQMIYDDPAILYTKLEGPIKNLGKGLEALRLAAESAMLFIDGLLGVSVGFDNIVPTMEEVKKNSFSAGRELNKFINEVTSLVNSLRPLISVATTIIEKINMIFSTITDNITPIINLLKGDGISKYRNMSYEEKAKLTPMERMSTVLGEGSGAAIERSIKNNPLMPQFMKNFLFPPAAPTPSSGPTPAPGGAVGSGPVPPKVATAQVASSQQARIPMMPVSLLAEVKEPKLALSDAAVVKGLQVAKPIQINPRSVSQTFNMNISTLNVTANDAQSLGNKLVSASREGFKSKMGIPGALAIDAATSRGIDS